MTDRKTKNKKKKKNNTNKLIIDFSKKIDCETISDSINQVLKTQMKAPVDKSTVTFLRGKTWWNHIHSKFQSYIDEKFPGTHLVAMPCVDSVDTIMKSNKIFIPGDNIKLYPMERGDCHNNVRMMFLLNTNMKMKTYTGYGLSDDGLWRFHSWISDENDNIVETTDKRLIYIGYDNTTESELEIPSEVKELLKLLRAKK